MAVTLTSLSHGAGCGCKLPAAAIHPLVRELPVPADPSVLVGSQGVDDAGVYRLTDELAIVQSVDFFTPIVDDPRTFGRIAAANAISDVYAMGGEPRTALNLVAFPLERLGGDVLREVLHGGAETADAAGVAVIGGHSIDDAEPKYGMAVTGTVHPDAVITNSGGRVGDVLVLTKPLGAGAVTTAAKRGLASPEAMLAATDVMCALNREAAAEARAAGAHAVTDVTGFGLLGHLHELARASGVAAELEAGGVPALPGARELLADDRAVAGGSRRNRAYAEQAFAEFAPDVDEVDRRLVCDAMTSGGLLVALAPERVEDMPGAIVGRLVAGEPGRITVRP